MHRKYIAILSAFITIFTQPAIAQVPPEVQQSSPNITAPINTNIPITNTNSFDQTGIVQQFNNGFNSLSQPNCRTKICLFTLIRNSSHRTELLGGAVWQLGGSPEDTQAESQRLFAIAQKEKLDQQSTVILIEKLAEAIETKKMERAKLYAISLAKKLGYADYRQLLSDISNPVGLTRY
ncbi:MAG: hypothetical protein HC815_38430 [Richelia sp. RM1_1_1]|nr:hypothetical protein [Richelia sp. RM1_1_1]